MNHKQKKALARRLITPKERKDKVHIFDSDGWNNRKEAISERVKKREQKQSKNI